MERTITAIYRTHQTAARVRDELRRAGVPPGHIHVIPATQDHQPPGGRRSVDDYNRALHRLHLPEDDTRIYQQAVANGDYVVAVDVDDDAHVGPVCEVMRRPEDRHDFEELRRAYEGAEYIPFRHEDEPAPPEAARGRHETLPEDTGHVRGYSRAEPLRNPGKI